MNSQGLQQTQRQTQGLVLTPQLRQSLRILQVPATELHQEIAGELAANPLLEEIPPEENVPNSEANTTISESSPFDDIDPPTSTHDELAINDNDFRALQKMEEDWQDSYYDEHRSQSYTAEDAERRQHFFDSAVGEESLQEKLLAQARLAAPTPAILTAIQILVGNLDERGFMTADLGTLGLETGQKRADLEEAWRLLKTFDPPGIGAADLRECFLIQLIHSGRRHTPAALIVDEYFPLLLKRRIPEIARALDMTPEAVREAITAIALLDTAPARKYAQDENRIITPDIIVRHNPDDTDWEIILNNENIPRLRLNHTYKNLLAGEKLSAKDRAYITEKMRAGRFLIGAIEQRQQTLERIARLLLKYQADFFVEGVSKLHPLTMAQLAVKLNVHETTVSRAIANKYIQTPFGIFELRFFFTSGVTTDDGEAMANTSIKEVLADIVAAEDPTNPLSDETLVEALAAKGIRIARRTVAKYRDALKIPPAYLRKRH
ncbi:MAG: RNA polymerase factor sigma-54 [Puniceicoccales bacterium]|jgi:RNA polymerase sigma-54 factor|nr:RNA polymerase factor sigma-54 [Puniceicoccales bacterium]